MSACRVSVLMAVFNGGALLEKALGSVCAQSYSDWEMVVVDDASTDGTCAVVESWMARDRRIRLLKNASNKGQTACLNQGLRACRGGWVARQDADDLSHPERLAKQVEFLRRNPETVLLGTQGVLIDANGGKIGLLDVPCDEAGIHWCAPFLNPFLHTSVVFRRSVAEELGGYDEGFRIAQDYDLWTRMIRAGRTANLSERLVSYRHAETSLSKAGRDVAFAEADRVSAREARQWLGREWREDEAGVAGKFRRGLAGDDRRLFWKVIDDLERGGNSGLPARLRAMWHLRVAGSDRRTALPEMAAAFRADPAFAWRWVCERWLSP